MGNPTLLIWGVLFGAVGLGFLTYGRKQKAIVPLCIGIALCIMPYFVPNAYLLVITGIILIIIPYFFRF